MLRMLSDESRVRILRLLQREELSVADLQEVLGMGQSRISMHLSQLKQAGMVSVRRAGAKSLYHFLAPAGREAMVEEILEQTRREVAELSNDDDGLELILARRKDKLRSYFDSLAGRFGRDYVPGRSWEALCEMLLRLLPPMVIADLGAGEGTLALMLAQRATRVIAVDNSRKMMEYATALAERHAVNNLEYKLGDMEQLPLEDGEVDLALFHQSLHHALHPERAVAEAWRGLRGGGRIAVMDLLRHGREEAREAYGDVWLGFSQAELIGLLERTGFREPFVTVVHGDAKGSGFQTVIAIAEKPATT